MKPYRVKHKPTGLYFQPCTYGGSHLSKTGKIYQTKKNGVFMNGRHTSFRIQCTENSQVHKQTKAVIEWEKVSWGYRLLVFNTKLEDWELEEI